MTFPQRALLTLLAAAAFLPFLGRRDVVISHEARVVQTARLMASAGWPWHANPVTVPDVHLGYVDGDDTPGSVLRLLPDPAAPPLHVNPWVVPVLNNQIRLQKPPLPYWCAAVLFRLFGVEWSEAAARLTPALLGFLSTFLVHALARRLLGRRFALPAALIYATTHFVPDEYRKVMADPYLAFFTLAALHSWFRAATPSNPRPPSIRHLPSSVLAFYVFTALGLLAKGPPLFIHLAIPIVLFHLLHRRRPPGTVWLHLLGLAILLAVALPWPLAVYRHVPRAPDIWRYESVGEITDNSENARPVWFYLPNLFLITLPWTPVWLTACVLPWLRRRRRNRPFITPHSSFIAPLLPLLWYAITVAFFSLVHMKKNAYLLPVTPAQALLAAQGLVFAAAALRLDRRKNNPAGLLLGAQTLIPLGFAIALFVLIPRTALPPATRLFAAGLPAALAAAALRQLARRRTADWLILTALASGLALVAFLNFAVTSWENARSPRPYAAYIDLALRADPTITTIPDRLPPEATLYLPLNLAFNPRTTTILYLVDDPRGRAATDLASFTARLPDLHITAATPVPVPLDNPKPRYKLFALTLTPGQPKSLASAAATGR